MLSLPLLLSEEKEKQKDNTVSKAREINIDFDESNIIEDRFSCLYKPRQVVYTQALVNPKTSYMISFMTGLQKTPVLSDFNILLPESQL